jgi:hypothetical protein
MGWSPTALAHATPARAGAIGRPRAEDAPVGRAAASARRPAAPRRGALPHGLPIPPQIDLSESLQKFSVAIVATNDGRFVYQVFTVCGEPRTLLTDSKRYPTPADAARAGHEAIASMRS